MTQSLIERVTGARRPFRGFPLPGPALQSINPQCYAGISFVLIRQKVGFYISLCVLKRSHTIVSQTFTTLLEQLRASTEATVGACDGGREGGTS